MQFSSEIKRTRATEPKMFSQKGKDARSKKNECDRDSNVHRDLAPIGRAGAAILLLRKFVPTHL